MAYQKGAIVVNDSRGFYTSINGVYNEGAGTL